MVFGPDGKQPAIRTVAQKGCRWIFFVVAKPLFRSEGLVERRHDWLPVISDQCCMQAGQSRHTAIAARVRINGVLMTITYFAKNH